jgi:hypothetical protein
LSTEHFSVANIKVYTQTAQDNLKNKSLNTNYTPQDNVGRINLNFWEE